MLGIKSVLILALATLTSGNFPMPRTRDDNRPTLVHAFPDEPIVSYRLPNNTRPISYEVNITTNVHTHTDLGFSGQVAVRFVVLEASRTITLHHRQLTIGATSLVPVSNLSQSIELSPNSFTIETEFLIVTLATTDLIVGSEYILNIAYNGTHRTDKGFFYKPYTNAAGIDKYL